MKIYTKFLCGGIAIVAAGIAVHASAALTPVIYFSNINTSSYTLGVSGDANSSVTLYNSNPSGGTTGIPTNIGTTDQNGNFSTTVTSGSYGISNGSSVYVVVDGVQSNAVGWPSFGSSSSANSSGSLSLSQTNVTVSFGQSTTITAATSNGLYVSGNTNPSSVGVSVNGSQITITAFNYGTSNLTICATDTGCQTVYVTVGAVSSNNTTSGISFSQSNITLSVGQANSISIYGSGGYYVSSNSNSGVASGVINGTGLYITGTGYGSSNITVCQNGGQCGVVYVSVNSLNSIYSTNSSAAALTSFTVSSNDANSAFMNGGDMLTISFTANQSINNPSITIAGTRLSVGGSGNGPYTMTYNMTGSEALPMPLIIGFDDLSGNYHQFVMSLGGVSSLSNVAVSAPAVTTTVGCPAGNVYSTINGELCAPTSTISVAASASNVSSSTYQFANPLSLGSTGADVTALQQRLTADGIYSGPITGYYGDLTESAVMAYQSKHGIDPIGRVGPSTRALLNQGI